MQSDELSVEDQKTLDDMRNEAPEPAAAPEPATEPTAEPEAAPEPVADERPRDESGRFVAKEEAKPEEKPAEREAKVVPLASLLEERKEWQRKLDETNRNQAVLDERFRQMQERFAKPEVKAPTIDEDPVAVLRQTEQRLAQVERQWQQDQAQQQFASHVSQKITEYKAATTDYPDAYAYARESYANELRAVYGIPEEHIAGKLAEAEFNLAASALQRGRNPGEAVYEFAKARGYRKAEAAPAQAQAAPAAQGQSPLEKLAAISAGQAASKTLSGGGSASPVALTMEAFAKMTPEEFAKVSDDDFRRAMGG